MPRPFAAFTDHPREAGQTYAQHLSFALWVAGQALVAGLAAAVHAVLPFLFQHTAGNRIRALAERIEQARRLRARGTQVAYSARACGVIASGSPRGFKPPPPASLIHKSAA